MDNNYSLFALPNDIKKDIFSLAVGSTKEAISLQAASKGFQSLVWKSLTKFSDSILFDRARTIKIFERIDKSAIKYLEVIPLPPSPANDNFELDLTEFPSLEYLSLEDMLLLSMLNNPKLKDAFMNHKTLTSVKCITTPGAALSEDLIHEISQTKKLYLLNTTSQHMSPTVTYMTRAREFTIKLEHVIGGFDGAPTAGNAAGNFVLIGSDNGTVTVFKTEDGQLKFQRSIKAHQGRINHVHTHSSFPKKSFCIASSDGTVSLWDVENNYEEPRSVLKFGEPIYFVCARINKTQRLIIAAGKQTAYMFNINTNELVKVVPIGSDIIGVDDDSLVKKGFAVCTHQRVHILNDSGEETSTFKINIPKRFYVTSDHSAHFVLRENDAQIRIKSRLKTEYYESGEFTFGRNYDERPHTGAIMDKQMIVLLSTGYGFDVLDLQPDRPAPIMSIGLPVTKKEIATKNYKQVIGLFVQDEYWHAIGSDGKVYSWKIFGKESIESLSFAFVFAEDFEKF